MDKIHAQEFADLAQQLRRAGSIQQTAAHVVEQARSLLHADHAGITLIRAGGHLESVACSDEMVVKADVLQYDLNEGPCRDAAVWDQGTLASQDLANDSRWPNWAPQASELGICSALAAELTATDTGRRLGALNLYWSTSTVFTADDLAYANIFAVHAAIALESSEYHAQLNTALDTRNVIGAAQGILMERYNLTVQQSFEVLRRYSQDYNRKLREVAQHLVDTRDLPIQSSNSNPGQEFTG